MMALGGNTHNIETPNLCFPMVPPGSDREMLDVFC